jgi:Ca-activated chloride channel family protein
MFARLRSPRLSDLRLEWPDGTQALWTTALPLSVFSGDTVNVYAGFARKPNGEVRLQGRPAGQAHLVEVGRAPFAGELQDRDSLSRVAAFTRINARALTTEVLSQAERTQLAVDYQLVSQFTNFVLVHERSEAEKPLSMPELHKVRQMVPAGWGGVGRVMDSVPNRPVVAALACMSTGAFDADELLAFSRPARPRAPPAPSSPSLPKPSSPRKPASRILYSKSASPDSHFDDLPTDEIPASPAGLSAWLRATSRPEWPKSYEALRAIGLDRWVIEWLQLVAEKLVSPPPGETVVVLAFLAALASDAVFPDYTPTSASTRQSKAAAAKAWAPRSVSQAPESDVPHTELVARIVTALQGLTATQWPARFFDLEPVAQ